MELLPHPTESTRAGRRDFVIRFRSDNGARTHAITRSFFPLYRSPASPTGGANEMRPNPVMYRQEMVITGLFQALPGRHANRQRICGILGDDGSP